MNTLTVCVNTVCYYFTRTVSGTLKLMWCEDVCLGWVKYKVVVFSLLHGIVETKQISWNCNLSNSLTDECRSAGKADLLTRLCLWQQRAPRDHPTKRHSDLRCGAAWSGSLKLVHSLCWIPLRFSGWDILIIWTMNLIVCSMYSVVLE